MKTKDVILMLVVVGGVMLWQMRDLLRQSPWYGVPILVTLIFVAVFQYLFQRPGVGAKRRALLFGVGIVALVATGVFTASGYSLVRLLNSEAPSFDAVSGISAIATGVLAVWLWFRFLRLLRQA